MSIWHSWVIAHWFEARFNGILGDMRTNLRMKYVISVLFFYLGGGVIDTDARMVEIETNSCDCH